MPTNSSTQEATQPVPSDLIAQLKKEYDYAFQYINPRRIQVLDRLRLYSNQKRDKELVGDTTLFTIFNTVHSKLYEDELSAVIEASHPDDTDTAEYWNNVIHYDYDKMNMPQVSFDWNWYTGFWGAGFLDVSAWDTKRKLVLPSVIDNATFLIDPECTLINGDNRGFGAARFWGREVAFTKEQMKKRGFKDYEGLTAKQEYQSLTYQDKQFRRSAQNLAQPVQPIDYENDLIPCLEWWTIVKGVKKVIVVDLNFQNILKVQDCPYDEWPLIHRKLFPIPGDPFGVSIPDLIEDKQRAKAVLTNLGLSMAKADLYPMYVYDRNVISPTSDLSFAFNKWIPADGNPKEGVTPLQKPSMGQIVQYIMSTIDEAAQRATAAQSMQQGDINNSPRSANEVVRVFDQAQARITTGAKVFAWSERGFIRWIIKMYDKYFTSAHAKLIKIQGAFGPKFEKLTGEDLDFTEDPDIHIESKILNDAKNQDDAQRITAFANLVAQDQSVNRRYFNKRAARVVLGLTQAEIDRLYPPTADELKAQTENDQLNKNKIVKIDIHDDHQAHLLIHANADDTKASVVHIAAHKKALMLQRQMAAMNPENPTNPSSQPQGVQTQPNIPGTGSQPAAQGPAPFQVQ